MDKTDIRTSLQAELELSPYNAFCGFRIIEANREAGTLTMLFQSRPEHHRLSGSHQIHGGPVAAFIDTAGCFACIMMLGHGVPTINFRVDYLRPAQGESLKASARVRKIGRSISTIDIDVVDESDKVIAIGRGTYSSSSG